jgi:X-X-X-Leu-X-X-Gly heptad repeat protein
MEGATGRRNPAAVRAHYVPGAGSGKLEAGSGKLEAGSWKLEAGSGELEAGSWKRVY